MPIDAFDAFMIFVLLICAACVLLCPFIMVVRSIL